MKALITEEFHPLLYKGLISLGIECNQIFDIDTVGVKKIIQDYEILIVNSKILIDEDLLKSANKLKVIGRVGSGLEIIDLKTCEKMGIAVENSPEGNQLAVAEHALGLLLAMMNRMMIANDQLKKGLWIREGNRGEELSSKTVAIIGFGHTGSSFAKLLKGFEIEILAVDPFIEISSDTNVKLASMQEVYEKADIVSLHLPLNKETIHFANDEFFNSFKKSIWFINTSRGKVCDTKALIDYIISGKIKGAGLDVYENEVLASFNNLEKEIWCKLSELPNVIKTPHIAGWTVESKEKLASVLLEKIKNQIQKLGI